MKTTTIAVAVRAAETLCRHEIMDIAEFCRHTDTYFRERAEELKREVEEEPKPNPDDEDDVYGYEMYTEDRFTEVKHHRNYAAYFGVLMVFSAFERFLQHLYDTTIELAIVPRYRDAILEIGQRRLTLEHFKTFLRKLGVEVSEKPYQWSDLVRLQQYRNAIAHQGGWVTETNARLLLPYRHEKGEKLDIDFQYVQRSARLVQETARQIGQDYLKALKKKSL